MTTHLHRSLRLKTIIWFLLVVLAVGIAGYAGFRRLALVGKFRMNFENVTPITSPGGSAFGAPGQFNNDLPPRCRDGRSCPENFQIIAVLNPKRLPSS